MASSFPTVAAMRPDEIPLAYFFSSRSSERAGNSRQRSRRRVAQSTCAICLEAMTSEQRIRQSWCQPVRHAVHEECWLRLSESQRSRCCLCRQREIDTLDALMIYNRFPDTSSRDFDPDAFLEAPGWEWLAPRGRNIVSSHLRGEISENKFKRIANSGRATEHRWRCLGAWDYVLRSRPSSGP